MRLPCFRLSVPGRDQGKSSGVMAAPGPVKLVLQVGPAGLPGLRLQLDPDL